MSQNQNLSVSLELIYLMGWLLRHKRGALKALVEGAIDEGLATQLEHIDPLDQTTMAEQLHETLLEFLLFLEDSLHDSLEPEELSNTEALFTPMVNTIDTESLDAQTLWASIRQAKQQMAQGEKPEAKTALLKSLLKNWQPDSQEPVN